MSHLVSLDIFRKGCSFGTFPRAKNKQPTSFLHEGGHWRCCSDWRLAWDGAFGVHAARGCDSFGGTGPEVYRGPWLRCQHQRGSGHAPSPFSCSDGLVEMLHSSLCVDQLEGLLQDGAQFLCICLQGVGGGRWVDCWALPSGYRCYSRGSWAFT